MVVLLLYVPSFASNEPFSYMVLIEMVQLSGMRLLYKCLSST